MTNSNPDTNRVERVARAIWRDMYGKRGEEHAFEFHTHGEQEAMSAATAAITIMDDEVEGLKQWALEKASLHHRFAHEDEHLRAEHIASSSAYISLAEEIAARAALSNKEDSDVR